MAFGGQGLLTLGLGIVGAYFLGPIGFMVGSAIGGMIEAQIFKPEKEVFEQESLKDISITSETYGRRIPKLFGRRRLAGNIIWATDLVETEHRETTSGGGGGKKGGGGAAGGATSITKSYSASFALALCEGIVHTIDRVWFDATLVFDRSADVDTITALTVADDETEGVKGVAYAGTQKFRLFSGSEQQEPSAYQESIIGVGDVPAYKGTAYIEFEDIELGSTGRIPNITVEAAATVLPTGSPVALVLDESQDDQITLWVAYTAGTIGIKGTGTALSIETEDLEIGITGSTGDSSQFIGLGTNGAADAAIIVGNQGGDPTLTMLNAQSGQPLSDAATLGEDEVIFSEAPVLDDVEIGTNLDHGFNHMITVSTNTFCLLGTIPRVVAVSHLTGTRTKATPGTTPVWIANDATNIYVVNQGADTVSGFVQATMAATGTPTVATGDGPSRMAVDTANDRGWITDTTDGTVTRITPSTMAAVSTITVGASPVAIVVASDAFVWCSNTGATTVSRIDPSDDSVETFTLETAPGEMAADSSGGVWVSSGATSQVYHVTSAGVVLNHAVPQGPGAIVSDANDVAYLVCTTASVFVKAEIVDGVIEISSTADSNGLGCVVRFLNEASGLAKNDIDVSALDNTPVHMVINAISNAIEPLQELMKAYQFSAVETSAAGATVGGFLKYYFKGGTSQATLPESVLATGSDTESDRDGLGITRTQEIELPTFVSVTYLSAARNYDLNTQHASMVSSQSPDGKLEANFSLALLDQEAKNLSETFLYEAWLQRHGFTYHLPPKYSLLEPMDITDVTGRGQTFPTRILEADYGSNGVLDITAAEHHSYIYEGFRASPGLAPSSVQTVSDLAAITATILDIPPFVATDILLVYGVAIHTTEDGDYLPSSLHRSIDSEVTFQQQLLQNIESITGTVALATADAPETIWDETTSIVVIVREGAVLTSASDLQVLAGTNWALIGAELIGFGIATLGATETYTLTHLLRGRQGTEPFTGTHTTAEAFTLMDNYQKTLLAAMLVTELNISLDYKAVNPRQAVADVASFQATLTGRRIIPWAPPVLASSVDGSDNWDLEWLQRSRLQGVWTDGVGIGIDFDHVGFRIRIYETEDFSTVLRTVDTDGGNPTDPEATKTYEYTIADQTTDFGFHNPHLFIGISQLSSALEGDIQQAELQEVGVSSLTNSLEAWWKLKESSGTRADSIGSNTLADINTVTQAVGQVGNAAQFTRANDESLTIADNASLSLGADSDFQICAWVYLDSDPGTMVIASKGDSTATLSQEFQLIYSTTFQFSVGDGASSTNLSAATFGTPSLATWVFVMAWHDSTLDTLNIQINNGTVDSVAHALGTQDTAQEFAIGQWSNLAPGGGSSHWDGRIDEVGFWKGRILIEQERNDVYNSGNGITTPFVN